MQKGVEAGSGGGDERWYGREGSGGGEWIGREEKGKGDGLSGGGLYF